VAPEDPPRPMSEISGLHGPPDSDGLSMASVPRFGVQTDQEGQLAKVRPPSGSVWMPRLGPQFPHLYPGQLGLGEWPGVGLSLRPLV
jgi:hypothetical protein